MCVQGFFFSFLCCCWRRPRPSCRTRGIQRPKNNEQCLCTYIVVGLLLSRNKYTLLQISTNLVLLDNMRNYSMCCQPDEKVLLGGRASFLHGGLVKKVFFGGRDKVFRSFVFFSQCTRLAHFSTQYDIPCPSLLFILLKVL